MNHSKHHPQRQHLEHTPPRQWKGWHRHWLTYVVVVLMLVSMFIYVVSLDLELSPVAQPPDKPRTVLGD